MFNWHTDAVWGNIIPLLNTMKSEWEVEREYVSSVGDLRDIKGYIICYQFIHLKPGSGKPITYWSLLEGMGFDYLGKVCLSGFIAV